MTKEDRKMIEDKLEELRAELIQRGAEVWQQIFNLKARVNALETERHRN